MLKAVQSRDVLRWWCGVEPWTLQTGWKSPLRFPMGMVPFLLRFLSFRIAEEEGDIIPKEPGFAPSRSSLPIFLLEEKGGVGLHPSMPKKK